MPKINDVQLKELFEMACQSKNQGKSLSEVFSHFAKKTGRAKGSVRNVYYQNLKKMSEDQEFRLKIIGKRQLGVAKIISFEDAEADLLLEKIFVGTTFGKSVRRVISEMTDSPKLALRYQNKYRNLLKYEQERVQKVRQKIIAEYGKCVEPYQKNLIKDENLNKLKREINNLYDKIAEGIKAENLLLKQRIKKLEEENQSLKKKTADCHIAERFFSQKQKEKTL